MPEDLIEAILAAIGPDNTAKYPISTAYHDGEWWINVEIQQPRTRHFDIETHDPVRATALKAALHQVIRRKRPT